MDQTKFTKTVMASRTYRATYTSYFTSYLPKAGKLPLTVEAGTLWLLTF